MNKLITFLALFLLISANLKAQKLASTKGIDKEALQRYESFLNSEIDNGNIAGAVSLISLGDSIVHHKAMGYSHLAEKDPMTTDHIFFIQSMTKPIVSTAMMILYDEGHFLLDDPVSKYLPKFEELTVLKKNEDGTYSQEELNNPIRIWHLLSHTAGFSHGLGTSEYDKKVYHALYNEKHETIHSRVDALLEFPLLDEPGKQWIYSASPDILAVLIEKFSGISCDQFLQTRIFEPLGMSSTGYNVSLARNHLVAGLHQAGENGKLISIPDWNSAQGNTVYGGTHGLYSTAADYAKFCRLIMDDGTYNDQRIISHKSVDIMTENHIVGLAYSPGLGFGLGFGLKTDVAASKLIGSDGTVYWSGMFNTYFFIDPTENLIGILMTQSFPYNKYYWNKMRQFIYAAIE